jgi:hypothetical protein
MQIDTTTTNDKTLTINDDTILLDPNQSTTNDQFKLKTRR